MKKKPNAMKLLITLEGVNPAPWREIDIGLSSNFTKLHAALQAAFLWQNAHLWEFEINGKCYGTDFCIEEGDDIGCARTTYLSKLLGPRPN